MKNKIEKYVDSTLQFNVKLKLPIRKPIKYLKEKIKKLFKGGVGH